jgi:hypothetical protein
VSEEMKNLIMCALILAVLSLILGLFQYGINVTGIYVMPRQVMVLVWLMNTVLNSVPIILISYVLLQKQIAGEQGQDFNKQGYKR